MKKLLVITFALLMSSQAMAVGPMSKDEARDGTLVCFDKLQKETVRHNENPEHLEKRAVDVAVAK